MAAYHFKISYITIKQYDLTIRQIENVYFKISYITIKPGI